MGFVPHLLNFMGFCPTVLSTFHLRHAWMWMRDQLTFGNTKLRQLYLVCFRNAAMAKSGHAGPGSVLVYSH